MVGRGRESALLFMPSDQQRPKGNEKQSTAPGGRGLLHVAWKEKHVVAIGAWLIISAGVPERREAGACGVSKCPQCRSARGRMHSKLCHAYHNSGGSFSLRIPYQFPGTLGQRGGRVTGKWILAPHYIKGCDCGRKSGESRPAQHHGH